MRRFLRKAIYALVALVILLPLASNGDQMPLPLEKKIAAGTSTITYLGQTLRFTTPIALLVKCNPTTPTQFDLSVVLYPGTPPPQPSQIIGSADPILQIYWENYQSDIYEGEVPMAYPWVASLSVEGGFVDR